MHYAEIVIRRRAVEVESHTNGDILIIPCHRPKSFTDRDCPVTRKESTVAACDMRGDYAVVEAGDYGLCYVSEVGYPARCHRSIPNRRAAKSQPLDSCRARIQIEVVGDLHDGSGRVVTLRFVPLYRDQLNRRPRGTTRVGPRTWRFVIFPRPPHLGHITLRSVPIGGRLIGSRRG